MGDLSKALFKHRAGVGVGMVLVGLIAAGVLAERKQHRPPPAALPAEEPELAPLPPVGRATLVARLASAYEKRRSPKNRE